MKLISFRAKDEAHIKDLDEQGLITPEIEASLPPVLRERLATARARLTAQRAAGDQASDRGNIPIIGPVAFEGR